MNAYELLDFISNDKNLKLSDIDALLQENNIEKGDFLALKIPALNKENVIKEKYNLFWSLSLYSAYQGHENLFNYANNDFTLKSPLAYYEGYMKVMSSLKSENILSNPYIYKWLPEKGMKMLLDHFDSINLTEYKERNVKNLGYFNNKNFAKSIFPIWLKNKSYNLLDMSIIPLINNYNEVHRNLMRNGSIEDIEWWVQAISDNRLNMLNATPMLKNAKDMLTTMLSGNKYNITFDLLETNNIYEMLSSNGKKNEDLSIEKMSFLLSHLNEVSRSNFLYNLKETSEKVNNENMEKLGVDKNAPIMYAIVKKQTKVIEYFEKIGYEFSDIEKQFLSSDVKKEESVEVDFETLYINFVKIAQGKSQRAETNLDKFLMEISEDKKKLIFDRIHEFNDSNDKKMTNYYNMETKDNELQKIGSEQSVTTSMILNSRRNMLSIMLKNGYELTEKEFGLIYIMFSRYTGIDEQYKKSNPESNVGNQLEDFSEQFKNYSVDYKSILMNNVIRFISEAKKNDTALKYAYMVSPIVNIMGEDKVEIKSFMKERLYSDKRTDGLLTKIYLLPLSQYFYQNYPELWSNEDSKINFVQNVLLNNGNTFATNKYSRIEKQSTDLLIRELNTLMVEEGYNSFKSVLLQKMSPSKKDKVLEIFINIEKEQIINAMKEPNLTSGVKKRL